MTSLENLPYDPAADEELLRVAAKIRHLDPDGTRAARVFRATFDQLYDGQRTGRYRVDQLFKTEKTHFGTLIEINLQREFEFEDGHVLDFCIEGVEVDCKYSHTGGWMLPLESFDRLVLVGTADDQAGVWSLGLVRVVEAYRRGSSNRDMKTSLNKDGRAAILWLFQDCPMPPNALLQIPQIKVDEIMLPKSGQRRINELFRSVPNRRLTRNIIATVAQQDDYMKRVRENGGARSALRPEGMLILSGDYKVQRMIALELGAEVPHRGEFVSVAVVRCGADEGVLVDGRYWRLAKEGETPTDEAPRVPHK